MVACSGELITSGFGTTASVGSAWKNCAPPAGVVVTAGALVSTVSGEFSTILLGAKGMGWTTVGDSYTSEEDPWVAITSKEDVVAITSREDVAGTASNEDVNGIDGAVPGTPVSTGALVVPLPNGADVVGIGDSTSEDSAGAELAGTVTVTVLADVTVTVAGPHSSPAAEEAPTGEFPRLDSTGKFSVSRVTGSGTTVTTEVMIGLEVTGADPVGPTVVVELPRP